MSANHMYTNWRNMSAKCYFAAYMYANWRNMSAKKIHKNLDYLLQVEAWTEITMQIDSMCEKSIQMRKKFFFRLYFISTVPIYYTVHM